MRRRASLATGSADRRVNNLASVDDRKLVTEQAEHGLEGLDIECRFTEGQTSEVWPKGKIQDQGLIR